MKIKNTALTTKEISGLNLNESDVMGYDYRWVNGVDNYYLVINSKRVVSFANSNDREKSFNKIKRMGLCLGWCVPSLTDEELGIIQAAVNGENPFASTIMCADPSRNKTVI